MQVKTDLADFINWLTLFINGNLFTKGYRDNETEAMVIIIINFLFPFVFNLLHLNNSSIKIGN